MPNGTEEQQTLTEFRDAAVLSKAWPFEEARKLLNRYKDGTPAKGHVLFETGYGPSGLPHIGTFGEVERTNMVRRAYEILSDTATRLVAFSDDMAGMRTVPAISPEDRRVGKGGSEQVRSRRWPS